MRKVMVVLSFVILLFLLIVTNSQYVEGAESFLIIGGIVVILGVGLLNTGRPEGRMLGIAAVLGFALCMILGSVDIIIDHYMNPLSPEEVDGAPLTLGFKLEEFNDDLFVLSVISMVSVLGLIFIVTRLFFRSEVR